MSHKSEGTAAASRRGVIGTRFLTHTKHRSTLSRTTSKALDSKIALWNLRTSIPISSGKANLPILTSGYLTSTSEIVRHASTYLSTRMAEPQTSTILDSGSRTARLKGDLESFPVSTTKELRATMKSR